ncbi:MAG TPA: hypothetical protein PLK68_07815, partial [Thomasclavelia ramosa]|nr:hypothetical protein [Thomasclavelia ramosa]
LVNKTRYKKFINALHKEIVKQANKSQCYTYEELLNYMHLPEALKILHPCKLFLLDILNHEFYLKIFRLISTR